MKVFQSPYEAGRWAPSSVAAIGKFDGMHIGHQRVIRLALRKAKALATKCLVVTFDPLPQEYFSPGSCKPLLTTRKKIEFLERMGVDAVVFLPFNRKLVCQSPRAFVRDILVNGLKVMAVCVGSDFCFGKDRAGQVDDLAKMGGEHGFLVHPVPLLTLKGEKVSSSMIRRLIEEGRITEAEHQLGRALQKAKKRR